MTHTNDSEMPQDNFMPIIIGIMNFGLLLAYSLPNMSSSAEYYDFIFVAIGVYLGIKFYRNISEAHEYPIARVSPNHREYIPNEGIYQKVRHPVGGGAIYMNIAYVFFFRSFLIIPMIPLFAAMWYIYAKYEEKIMLDRFGDEYREYMRGTSMFRGAGLDQQRLASSGYSMY